MELVKPMRRPIYLNMKLTVTKIRGQYRKTCHNPPMYYIYARRVDFVSMCDKHVIKLLKFKFLYMS